MKSKILPFSLLLLSVASQAQTVISSQGDSYNNGTHQLDYTIGEPVIKTVTDGNNTLTQGFHQTNLLITKIKDFDENLVVSVFPNPTADHVKFSMEKFQGCSLQLIDATGKLINQTVLNDVITEINLKEYRAGEYFLILIDTKKNKIKSYQIIKV